MNGVHDMGGMHGMGPIVPEKDEPVFHSRWEARVYALHRAMAAWRKWNIDTGRHEIELLPAEDYLRMSYYEKWFARLLTLLVKTGTVTRAELESGKPQPGSPKLTPALSPDRVPGRGAPAPPRLCVRGLVAQRGVVPAGALVGRRGSSIAGTRGRLALPSPPPVPFIGR